MGGPQVHWKPGRTDFVDDSKCPPRGRLPDASLAHDHLRQVFYRMGFNDREIVALSGAHNLGVGLPDLSSFPWKKKKKTPWSLSFHFRNIEMPYRPIRLWRPVGQQCKYEMPTLQSYWKCQQDSLLSHMTLTWFILNCFFFSFYASPQGSATNTSSSLRS
jgi:hypothetical protein